MEKTLQNLYSLPKDLLIKIIIEQTFANQYDNIGDCQKQIENFKKRRDEIMKNITTN